MVLAGISRAASEAVMDRLASAGSESRFSIYVERLVEVIGHADRASPFPGTVQLDDPSIAIGDVDRSLLRTDPARPVPNPPQKSAGPPMCKAAGDQGRTAPAHA